VASERARAPEEELYGLPLEEFTPARDALAKKLRAGGDKDGAAEVKRLKKPSLPAWALNQAARRHGPEVRRLLEAGVVSREAQEQALAGDAGPLREATRALSDEVEHLTDLAASELARAGREASAAQRDRIAATLRAAAVDEEGGRLLERGMLVDELEPAGFGGFGDSGGRPAPAHRRAGAAPSAPAAPKRSKEEVEAIEAARRDLRRAEAEAEAAATRARRRADRAQAAEQRALEVQREAEAVRNEAEEAAGEAEAARRRAEEAARRLAAAETS
jgi:hypothetical protein